MAKSHPYISGPRNIAYMIKHLRKNFPTTVNSDTVKKLGLAPQNESYVINALQFVGVIDDDSKKTAEAAKAFSSHKDGEFASLFEKMVKKAYHALFELHSDQSWSLPKDELITFFRHSDQTSDAIGGRQASTFQVFAALSGHGEVAEKREKSGTSNTTTRGNSTIKGKYSKPSNQSTKTILEAELTPGDPVVDFGLSVKIEINLPSDASAETYDNIFKSIRKNLIDV
jgi:uncharacterized protein DUF5343